MGRSIGHGIRASVVGQKLVCPPSEQGTHDARVAELGCPHEWGLTSLIGRVYLGTSLDEMGWRAGRVTEPL